METRISQVLAHKGHEVHTVPLNVAVCDAARTMARLKIGSLLVEADGRVAGIITERDLARRVCAGEFDLARAPVAKAMTTKVAFVTPDTTVATAMKVMSETHCRHLPVIEDDELVGVISLGDLVRWVTVDLAENIRYLEGYILRA